jgi:hypothetical protein
MIGATRLAPATMCSPALHRISTGWVPRPRRYPVPADGVGHYLWLTRPDELRASMNASQPATILIVDGQVLFRAGLRATLAIDSGLSVVGDADDGESALKTVIAETPDIARGSSRRHVTGQSQWRAKRRFLGGAAVAVAVRMRDDSSAAISVRNDRPIGARASHSRKSGSCRAIWPNDQPA